MLLSFPVLGWLVVLIALALAVSACAPSPAPGIGGTSSTTSTALALPGAGRAVLPAVVDLNLGETQDVVLCDGTTARVKLLELHETRDALRNAVREARVEVEVNGARITLISATYHLPVTVSRDDGGGASAGGGVQLDCPVTRGYTLNTQQANPWALHKDARLRLWPAAPGSSAGAAPGTAPGLTAAPWLDPASFGYPVRQRWFASDTQMANEPVFVDGGEVLGPKPVYYHYGLDFGGTEGLVEIVAATDGLVVAAAGAALPEERDTPIERRYDVINIRDDRGWYWRYSHLQRIDVALGQRVRRGEHLGVLGKEGGSGGWSHLHLDLTSRQPSGEWGIQDAYAFAWQAWQQQARPTVIAVARPHRFAAVGEKVMLDGSKSWSASGAIARYEWTFTDGGGSAPGSGGSSAGASGGTSGGASGGATATGPTVERTYTAPGTYSEILKVTDAAGHVAYDFAVVQIVDPAQPDHLPPTIHANCYPNTGVHPGDALTFKVRTFRTTTGAELWDFGDGSPPVRVHSDGNANQHAPDGYAVTEHRYAKPGDYLARVERVNEYGYKAVGRVWVRVE